MKTFLIVLLCSLAACSGYRYDIYEENDFFKVDKNKDANYTQGLIVRAGKDITESVSESYAIAHKMYTPDNLRTDEPEPGDRGYAASLTGTYQKYYTKDNKIDQWGIRVGCIGPCAKGEDVQKFVHNDIGLGTDPRGWGTQLKDEPVIAGLAERQFLSVPVSIGNYNGDVITSARADIGTDIMQVSGRVLYRIGVNLPKTFTPQSIQVDSPGSPFRFFLFTGTTYKIVGHNVLFDGSFFRSNHQYPQPGSERAITELHLGAFLEYKGYRLVYIWNRATKEWEQGSSHSFGSLNLAWGW